MLKEITKFIKSFIWLIVWALWLPIVVVTVLPYGIIILLWELPATTSAHVNQIRDLLRGIDIRDRYYQEKELWKRVK